MKLPRAILADDHKILVEAFRKLLEPHFEIVATVSDGRALLEAAASLKPDLILLDIGMPLLNGLEAARQLKSKVPAAKLIFLTMHEDPDLAIEAMRAGASGYLLKTSLLRNCSTQFRRLSEAGPISHRTFPGGWKRASSAIREAGSGPNR